MHAVDHKSDNHMLTPLRQTQHRRTSLALQGPTKEPPPTTNLTIFVLTQSIELSRANNIAKQRNRELMWLQHKRLI